MKTSPPICDGFERKHCADIFRAEFTAWSIRDRMRFNRLRADCGVHDIP